MTDILSNEMGLPRNLFLELEDMSYNLFLDLQLILRFAGISWISRQFFDLQMVFNL